MYGIVMVFVDYQGVGRTSPVIMNHYMLLYLIAIIMALVSSIRLRLVTTILQSILHQ